MSLNFHPAPGTIVICDFNRTFIPPEMIKRRPVVVISPRFRSREGLCTVVPLSTTQPNNVMPYHCQLAIDPPLPRPFSEKHVWVKGDMVTTISLHRLLLPFSGKDEHGKRIYDQRSLNQKDFAAVLRCVEFALGLNDVN